MTTPLYLDPNTLINAAITKPSGYLGSLWNGVSVAGTGGAGARAACLAAAVGAAVVDTASTTTSTANVAIGLAQFVSAPLSGVQTISGTVDLAMLFGAATGSPTVQGALFIGILKPDGTLRSTLYSSIAFDTTFTATLSNTYTVYQTGLTLTSQTAQDGDLIVIEVGVNRTSATNSTLHFAGGGTAAISTNHTNFGTNGQTLVSFSQTLVFATPLAPTVSAAATAPETVTVSYARDAAITSYTVNRSTTTGAEASYATAQTAAGYVDTAATGNLLYYYTVTAINATGNATSTEVSGNATTLFLDVAGTPSPNAFPAGFLGAAGPAGNGGANARALQRVAVGGPQSSISASVFGGSTTTGIVQFLSDRLVAQTLSGTATVAFAISNPSNNLSVSYRILLGVLKLDGSALRGTLLAEASGSTGTSVALTTEITKFHATFALSSVVVSAGDVIVVEIAGFSSSSTSGTSAPPVVYSGGTTRITSSEAATSLAESRVSFSQTILFQPAFIVPLTSLLQGGGTIGRVGRHVFSSTLTQTTALLRAIPTSFAATLSLAGTFSAANRFGALLTASLTASAGAVRTVSRTVAASLTASGTAHKALGTTFTSLLTTSAALLKALPVSLAASLTPVGSTARAVSRALAATLSQSAGVGRQATRSFASLLSPGAALLKALPYSLAASLTPAGTVARAATHRLAGTLTGAGALTRGASHVLASSLVAAGALGRALRTALAAALQAVGSIVSVYHPNLVPNVVLNAALDVAGDLTRGASRTFSVPLTLASGLVRAASRSVDTALTLVGDVRRLGFAAFAASMLVRAGHLAKEVRTRFTASLPFTAVVGRLYGKTFGVVLGLASAFKHSLPFSFHSHPTKTASVQPQNTGLSTVSPRTTGTGSVEPLE